MADRKSAGCAVCRDSGRIRDDLNPTRRTAPYGMPDIARRSWTPAWRCDLDVHDGRSRRPVFRPLPRRGRRRTPAKPSAVRFLAWKADARVCASSSASPRPGCADLAPNRPVHGISGSGRNRWSPGHGAAEKAARIQPVGPAGNAAWQVPQSITSACCCVRAPGDITLCADGPNTKISTSPTVSADTTRAKSPRRARMLRTGAHLRMTQAQAPSGMGPSVQRPPAISERVHIQRSPFRIGWHSDVATQLPLWSGPTWQASPFAAQPHTHFWVGRL